MNIIKAESRLGFIGSFYNSKKNFLRNDSNILSESAKSLIKSIWCASTPCFKHVKDPQSTFKWSIIYSNKTFEEVIDLNEVKEGCRNENLWLNHHLLNQATHIVTGIKWGYEILFSIEIEKELHTKNEKEEIEKEFLIVYERLRSSNLNEILNNKFKCELKNDMYSDGKIITVNDLNVYLNEMPNKIKTINDGKGYQIEFQLTSIDDVKKIFAQLSIPEIVSNECDSFDLLESGTIEINSKTYTVYHLLVQSITENFTIRSVKTKQKSNETNHKRKMIVEVENLSLKDWNLLKSLEHKNIAKFYEIEKINKKVYLIKDYYEWDLYTEFDKKSIHQLEITSYLMQLVKAVEYLHSVNFLHSFINPKTIYVEKKKIKLGGFYFCQKLSNKDKCYPKTTNLYYEAPESEIGLPYDVWCMGFVLYEMCYSCSKGLEPVETFITELKEDWSSESPKGFTKKIKRFGKLLTSFIEYDPKLRLELSSCVENDKLLKAESDRLNTQETYRENLLHFIENFNRDKPQNYTVEKLIDDTGSFGNVFSILDPERNSKSMKIISTMRNDLTQTIREIEILKIMDHSNVIKYYEMFDYSNYVCIVTELCKDGDLQNYLACLKYKARQTLSVAKQIKFCHQLADGLSYIHKKHIIHRDIKPSNLLLINNNQTIKYADFGFSIQNNSADSFCGTYLGTINYAAPEIINGTPYSFKVDIWSLACVFYEIVTLNYAFSYDSNDRPQIFNKQPPKLPANHPLESLLNK